MYLYLDAHKIFTFLDHLKEQYWEMDVDNLNLLLLHVKTVLPNSRVRYASLMRVGWSCALHLTIKKTLETDFLHYLVLSVMRLHFGSYFI